MNMKMKYLDKNVPRRLLWGEGFNTVVLYSESSLIAEDESRPHWPKERDRSCWNQTRLTVVQEWRKAVGVLCTGINVYQQIFSTRVLPTKMGEYGENYDGDDRQDGVDKMHPSDHARIRIFHGCCIFPLTAVATGYTGAFVKYTFCTVGDRGRAKVGTGVLEL